MTNSSGPTIVLIGGKATLDSGAVVDSRQAMAGDEWDVVLRQALGSSEGWWSLAKGFVDVVLDQHPRMDAWALAWVGKSLKRPRADGTFTRVRTKRFLDQGEDLIPAGKHTGATSAFRSDAVSSRYRLLPALLRFRDLQGAPPAVIVGGYQPTFNDGTDIVGDRPLDYFVARWPESIIVLPHTPIVEAKARRVLERRPTEASARIEGLAFWTHPDESSRYRENYERLEELRQADSYVLSHDFHVTFWTDGRALRDPADLDAALTFVKGRYDLKLGLWDLACDPALRETLLTREELAQPATTPAAVPQDLAAAAGEKAADRREKEAAELVARRRHHEAIWPALSRLGWYIPPWQGEGKSYRLPVGPRVPSFYSDSKVPAVSLSLDIQKRHTVLLLIEPARSGRTEQFLRDYNELIAGITGSSPDPKRQAIWRITGKGWAGSPEGWPKLIQTIDSLARALAPHLERLGEVSAKERAGEFNEYRKFKPTREGSTVTLTVPASVQPTEVTEKTSIWGRLRGRKSR